MRRVLGAARGRLLATQIEAPPTSALRRSRSKAAPSAGAAAGEEDAVGWFVVAIVLAIVLVVGIWFLHRFYAKANREIALVRTGLGGQKVVLDGGCLALPLLHKVAEINLGGGHRARQDPVARACARDHRQYPLPRPHRHAAPADRRGPVRRSHERARTRDPPRPRGPPGGRGVGGRVPRLAPWPLRHRRHHPRRRRPPPGPPLSGSRRRRFVPRHPPRRTATSCPVRHRDRQGLPGRPALVWRCPEPHGILASAKGRTMRSFWTARVRDAASKGECDGRFHGLRRP